MYIQAWNKYLPVIMILVKRSVSSPQTLAMDMDDFVKSSGGKKIKLGFAAFSLGNGRIFINNTYPQIAKELVTLLSEQTAFKDLLLSRQLEFTMTNNCVLSITNLENEAGSLQESDPVSSNSAV